MLEEGSHSLSTAYPLAESILSEVAVFSFVNSYINNSEIEESALRKVGGAWLMSDLKYVLYRMQKIREQAKAYMLHYITK